MIDLSLMEIALYLLIGVFSFILGYGIRGLVELRAEKLDEYLEENEEEILEHIFEMLDAKIDEALEVEKEVVLMITPDLDEMVEDVKGERLKEYKGHEVYLVDEEGLGGYALPKSIFDKFIEEKYGKE